MEDPIIQEIRDWFDELFLWSANEISEKSQQLFTALWIEWFAEIVVRNKKYGFNATQKILADLVKLSFLVYSNIDNLPIERKVILPEKNWAYKFIVTSLPHSFLRWPSSGDFTKEDTNVLFLVSTWDGMHADIAKKIWIAWISWEINILGWAWIDIDHDKKILNIRDDSGSYGSCSDQLVQWMLKEYEDKWYVITINMKAQGEFFTTTGEVSPEVLLEKKLELLHSLLVPWEGNISLPSELSFYADAFEIFTQTTKECVDGFDPKYIDALRTFRDVLLENI